MSTEKEVSICPSLKIKVVFVASYQCYEYFIFIIHIRAVPADFFFFFTFSSFMFRFQVTVTMTRGRLQNVTTFLEVRHTEVFQLLHFAKILGN